MGACVSSFLNGNSDYNHNGISDRNEVILKIEQLLKAKDLKIQKKIIKKEEATNRKLIKKLIK
mgnify:CR=1 FL=1|tara:strand:- start:837 stop:1025 length:189 start_codon:yes stop_codon:yes gene_type:complete